MSELLPRRMNRTGIFVWEQLRLIITAGFDGDRVAREVFARPHRTDRALDSSLDDLCMLISFKLQDDGLTASELRARLSPPPPVGSPSARSLAGTLLDAVIELEADLAEDWRRALENVSGQPLKYSGNIHETAARERRERRNSGQNEPAQPGPSAASPL